MEKRRGNKSRKTKRKRHVILALCVALVSIVFFAMYWLQKDRYVEKSTDRMTIKQPELNVQLLTKNAYSRPGAPNGRIKNIVIHYVANPRTTAMQNRNYFEGLKDTKERRASSHFIVGLDGEIVQCIPTKEISFASNDRNYDTVSIETCHWEADGSYTKETYASLVHLTAWLCQKFDLSEDDVIRHYDITGKNCPKYFVEDENAWMDFKKDVKKMLEEK